MCKVEGYWNITPKIKHVSFPIRGKMAVKLEDGRIIIVPLSSFPSIKKRSFKMVFDGWRSNKGCLS